MAQYWICPSCETASLTWISLRWHFKGKHTGEPIPDKEEVQVTEELPEGYRVVGQSKKGVAAPVVGKGEGGGKEELEITTPEIESLPREPIELFYTILRLKGVKETIAKRLQMEFKLSPWMWGDAQEIASLLKGARIPSISADWIRSFLKQYGNTVELPTEGGEFGFVSGHRTKDEFFGRLEPQPREDSIDKLIRFQIYKESKEEEKVKETKLPPAFEAKLSAQERSYQETNEYLRTVMERLDKQDRKDEEAKQEARYTELRAEIRAISESKQGGSENNWLSAYLAERDKRDTDMQDRYQETIKNLGEKLAEATKEVAETRRDIDRKVTEAVTSQSTAREQMKKDLEAAGYAPKTKTKEELDHDLATQVLEIIPGKIEKGFDKIIDKIVPQGPTQPPSTIPQTPRTPQEIVEQTQLEEEILEEAKRKGKA